MGRNAVCGGMGGFSSAELREEDDDGIDWDDPESFQYGIDGTGAGRFSGEGYISISTSGYGGSSKIYVVNDECGESSDCSN